MKNVKGLVKIIKKKVDTGETTFESGWEENLVFDAFFTAYQPGAAYAGTTTTNTEQTNTTLDPEDLMYSTQDMYRAGGFYLYATDTYVANISPSVNSMPGTWYTAQPITGTAHVQVAGDGGATAPTELKMTQQILPPGTGTRNLYTFGLNAFGFHGYTATTWRGQQNPLTAVSFASPVTQDTTEVVVVLYRLQFLYSTSSAKSLNDYIFITDKLIGRASTTADGRLDAYTENNVGLQRAIKDGRGRYSFWGTPERGRVTNSTYVAGKPNLNNISLNSSFNTWRNSTDVNFVAWDGIWHQSYKMTPLDLDVGAFRGSFIPEANTAETSTTFNEQIFMWQPILPPGVDKTQQYFGKISAATVPFFSAAEVPNTDGTIVVDTSSYTPTFPEQWKIDISGTSGSIGVPEYSFMKRYTLGWNGNTLDPRFEPCITGTVTNSNSTRTVEYGILTEQNPNRVNSEYVGAGTFCDSQLHSMDYSDPSRFFTYADNFITFIKADKPYSISYGDFYDATFAPTSLGQVEYDELSDTVWLSCYDTGIYSIQDPFGTPTFTSYDLSTITDVSATVQNKCYAITVGTQSGGNSYRVIWAFMEGALVKSTDNGATWIGYDSTSTGGTTFVNATIEASWNAVHVIKADRNNANRLLYLFDPNPTSDAVGTLSADYYGEYKAEWWSPSGGATNVLTTAGALPIFYGGPNHSTKDIGWFFTGSGGTRSSWNSLKGYSVVRRQSQHLIGCTPRESNWYFSHFYLDRLGLSGTYNTAPIEIFWEQQIGGSPANYAEFTVGDTFDEKWTNDVWQYSYHFTRTAQGNFSNTYNANKSYMYTHIVDRNDDGHECLVMSNGRNNNIHMFEFNGNRTTLLGAFGTNADPGVPGINDCYYNRYVGRGLVVMNSYFGALSDGTTFLGIDPAKKLVGEIWQRYKWNGSSWVLRQDDNDPLTVKTTHSSTDALIGGATISFDDSGATQTFESGEAISFHVYNGVLNDGGTTFDIHTPRISFFDSERVTEVTGATIALNTPSDLIPEIYYDSVGETDRTSIPATVNNSNTEYYAEDTYNIFGITNSGTGGSLTTHLSTYKYFDRYYPCTYWSGGSSVVSGANIGTQQRYAHRKKTTLAASGDFESEFLLVKDPNASFDFYTSSNNAPFIHQFMVFHDTSTELNAYIGVVNAANYSDTSPVTTTFSINDFDYGFKISMPTASGNFGSLQTLVPPNYAWGDEVNRSEVLIGTDTNYRGSRPATFPMVIEVIESGSVVYTHTSTEYWHSIFNEFNHSNSDTSRPLALNTVAGWSTNYNSGLSASREGTLDIVNGRRCPFTIKRTGTTITYYLRDQLIYTSAASSSESLIPAQLHETFIDSNQSNSGTTITGLNTMSIFKKPAANDYWVRVGTSGSGNASFNPNFLYLQTAFRESFSIKIDGVEATVTGLEDNGTLSAGEVSVFPRQGLIRCSAADAGKTVTVSIPCAYR